MTEVIAERFALGRDGSWFDLATGKVVSLRVESGGGPGRSREQDPPADRAVLDAGLIGTHHWHEARVVCLSTGMTRLAEAIAREVRRLGVIPVRAGAGRCRRVAAGLVGRHLALLAWTNRDRRAIAAWRAIRTGGPTGSDAVVSLRRRAKRTHVEIRPLQGERGESTRVHIDELLPPLLQIVQEAEDEVSALSAVCRWIRSTAGVDAVAFRSVDGTSVAAIGWAAADDRPETIVDVRYHGERIGCVSARGRAAAVEDGLTVLKTAATLAAPALRARLDALATARVVHVQMPELIGASPCMGVLRDAVSRVATTSFAVLVEGESGTGKELVARAIHRLSPRRDRRLCAVNCAALGDDLFEAELFGHARGAFTGAIGARAGLFEDADGGTLFLDEVGELSPRAQAKLLRALQDGEIRRVGENAARRVNVRVVAATNRSLSDLAARGAFREDLVFRLAVATIRVPPLRNRIEDVPLLARTFWKDFAGRVDKHATLGQDALAALCRHRWPGNVRELQNVMAGLLLVAPARGRVTARHVAEVLTSGARDGADEPVSLDAGRARWEQRAVAAALARHGGRRSAAARELGLTRQGLSKAMKRLGLNRTVDAASRGVA